MGLAAKQRMNTDVRRSIFSVIVTSADYEDAFERLMSLNLRCVRHESVKVLIMLLILPQDWRITLDPLFVLCSDQREREVMRVVVDCAGEAPSCRPQMRSRANQ